MEIRVYQGQGHYSVFKGGGSGIQPEIGVALGRKGGGGIQTPQWAETYFEDMLLCFQSIYRAHTKKLKKRGGGSRGESDKRFRSAKKLFHIVFDEL